MSTGSHLLRLFARLPGRVRCQVFVTVAVLAGTVAACAVGSTRLGLARPYGDRFLNQSVAELDERTEVLVLGSSHIFCNVRAGELGRPAVSLAIPNAQIAHLRELTDFARTKAPNLRLVLIETSAVTLLPRADRVSEFEAEKRRQLDAAQQRRPADPIDQLVADVGSWEPLRPLVDRDTLNPEWLRMHAAREEGRRILEPGFHGWSAGSQVLRGEGENATAHASLYADDPAAAIEELQAMVRDLRAVGVTVRLIRTPHYPSYATHQDEAMQTAPHLAARTIATGDGELEKLFWDDFERPFPREQWFDEDHLNAIGACRYTETLAARIDEVLGE